MSKLDKAISKINQRMNELKEQNRAERLKCDVRQDTINELENLKFMLEDMRSEVSEVDDTW